MQADNSKIKNYIDSFTKDQSPEERKFFEKILKSVFELEIDQQDIFAEKSFAEKTKNKLQEQLFNMTIQHIENDNLTQLAVQIGCAKKVKEFIQNNIPKLIELIYDAQENKIKNNQPPLYPCYFIEKYQRNGMVIVEDIVTDDPPETLSIKKDREDIYISVFESFEEANEIHAFTSELAILENKEIEKDPYLYKLIQKKGVEDERAN